MNYLGFKVNRS